MKHPLLILLLVFVITGANAQNKTALSLGGELGIPNYGLYNVVLGASAKFELPVVSPVSLSLTAGFSSVFQRSSILNNYNSGADLFVPLKAGVKYYFSQNVYLEGEGGAALPLNGNRHSLGLFSVGPGFVIPSEKHGVDIGFRYEDWQGQLKQTAIRVAYRFGL
ncbi:MAG: hypothetical protein JSU01_05155 [Bacteroidetes bacterium]|nr:hypothetical protein [Bacteroidota bacterium]